MDEQVGSPEYCINETFLCMVVFKISEIIMKTVFY